MIFTTKNKVHVPNYAAKIIVSVFWLCVWQIIYVMVGQEILVVSPACVFERLIQLSKQGDFWLTSFFSMLRILEGFLIGALAGVLMAVLSAWSKVCRALIQPVVSVVKATPVASFIILALVWMHAEFVPAFSASLIVFPVIWGNVLEGIRKTDEKLLQMGHMFQFSSAKMVHKIYIPSIMPYFMAACTTSLGLSWKAGVAAEVLSSIPMSVGTQIYNSKIYLETADLFAWTVVVILFSILLEKVMTVFMRRAAKKFNFGL